MTANSPIVVIDHLDPECLVPSGIDTIVHDLVRFAQDREIRIVGITTAPYAALGVWTTIEIAGREVLFLPVARFDRRAARKLIPHSVRFILGLLRHRHTIKSQSSQADIHTHRLETGRAVLLLRIGHPVQFIHNAAANLTGANSESAWRLFAWLYRGLEDSAVRHSRALVVFNRLEAQRLEPLAPGRCIAARTWFDPDVFFPLSDATQRDTSDRLEIAWVGRLEEQKNPLLAIDVANALRARSYKFRLILVGDGSLREKVQDQIREQGLGPQVEVAGALSRDQVAETLRRSSLLLMTSHYEGSPTALVEALACGTPVIATIQSDQDGLLDGRSCGTRIEPDPVAIATAVAEMPSFEPTHVHVADRAAPKAVARFLSNLDTIIR